jgi:CubicO group peptidase (beta-lactamase class C family)
MKKVIYVCVFLLISIGSACAQNNSEISEFSIKDTVNGFTAEQSRQFKQEFGVASALSTSPLSVWFHSHASQIFPTAIVPRRQPAQMLPSDIIPEIGKVVAKTELGEPYKGAVESMLEVMKEAKSASKPGEYYTYSSTATQALVILTEAVTGQTWADAFDARIWSKMGVEGSLQVHLSPDGYALGHGILSLRLRDLARFGMLYTPSWKKVTAEPIVTPEILKRTSESNRSRAFYRAGPSGENFMKRLGDNNVRTAARQWDAIWDDGDFFKSGLNTQGIYVSPVRGLVIAYFSVEPKQQVQKYLRPIVTSGLFDK